MVILRNSCSKDKRNREQIDHVDYSLNLQLPSNLEAPLARNNILGHEASPQAMDNIREECAGACGESSSLGRDVQHALESLVASNHKRPDYLVSVLTKIRAISEDEDSRLCLLRSLRALSRPEIPLVDLLSWKLNYRKKLLAKQLGSVSLICFWK